MDKSPYNASPRAQIRSTLTKIERVGRGAWLMLHMLAERFKDSPELYREIVVDTIEKVLPCPICQEDAREYLRGNPITRRTHPPLWICLFHNRINLKLQKQVFPCEPCMPPVTHIPAISQRRNAFSGFDGFVDTGYYLE